MKKILSITLALCAIVAAMACGSNDPDVDSVTGATDQHGEGGEGTAKGKMLVIYFSRADENWQVGYVERGNTAVPSISKYCLLKSSIVRIKPLVSCHV